VFFDVIDGPDGNDASLRPNQLFAVSLQRARSGPGSNDRVDVCPGTCLRRMGFAALRLPIAVIRDTTWRPARA